MLRDASQRQTSQKFSFISSLNLSRAGQTYSRSPSGQLNRDRAFGDRQRQQSEAGKLATQTTQTQPTTAIATTSEVTTIDSNWYKSTTDYSLSLAEIVNTTNGYLEPTSNYSMGKHLGKIVFALACSYGLFVSYWLFGHQGSKILTLLTGGKQIALLKSEVQFIDYMERSLAQIDREIAAKKNDEGEVVYVPVYTPNPKPSSSIPLTALPSPSTPTVFQPQVAPSAPLAIPAPPPLASPTPIAENTEQAIAVKPQIDHTLIGVLELGADSSAALIKVSGQTRRIWLGEKIHTDGWILESIGNQQATISRQGQVRSISVGETF